MTFDEAREAGHLVDALEAINDTITKAEAWSKQEPDDLIGIGCSVEHSDSGASGLGTDALLPAGMVLAALGSLRGDILVRLVNLGVRPE